MTESMGKKSTKIGTIEVSVTFKGYDGKTIIKKLDKPLRNDEFCAKIAMLTAWDLGDLIDEVLSSKENFILSEVKNDV